MAILIPEVIIFNALRIILKIVRENYGVEPDKKKTILYHIFGEDEEGEVIRFEDFKFFDQAVDIFIKGGKEKKREVDVTIGYNLSRAETPTIHIMLPNESPKNSGIGIGEGYIESLVDTANRTTIPVYTQDCSVTYNLLLTSTNMGEVLVLYHFLKAMFLSIKNHLELKNFQNVVFGGSDLNFNEDLIPSGIFHRNFNVNFDYDFSSIDIFARKFGKNFKFDLQLIDPV